MVGIYFGFVACAVLSFYGNNVFAEINNSTATSSTHHIVSLVKQPSNEKSEGNFQNITFEPVNATNPLEKRGTATTQEHIFKRFFQRLDSPVNTDDLLYDEANTLENTEMSFKSGGKEKRTIEVRRSIPVLEPVKHLLNTVRDGGLNHTLPNSGSKDTRHQLLVPNRMTSTPNESSAIETEEEREMVNESTEFQFIDTIGRIGSKIFEFFGNLQRLFAASSGSASASSSSSLSSLGQ